MGEDEAGTRIVSARPRLMNVLNTWPPQMYGPVVLNYAIKLSVGEPPFQPKLPISIDSESTISVAGAEIDEIKIESALINRYLVTCGRKLKDKERALNK